MRTQDSNPIYHDYRHLLARPNRYPAEHVNVFWNEYEPGSHGVCNVEVVFVPRGGHIPVQGPGSELWRKFGEYISRWDADMGNACDGWLGPRGLNPAQIFGHLLRVGFASLNDLIEALHEFSMIEGEQWAADMLSSFVDEEEVEI